MPDVIDLIEDPQKKCPFDNSTKLNKVVYFHWKNDLGSDAEGEPLKDRFICMTCGYEAFFYRQVMRDEIQQQADECKPKMTEILDMKDKLKDSRRNHTRIK